jgi:hypothetical protein
VHSQNFAEGGVLALEVKTLIDEAAKLKDKVWLTSGDQIDAWWRARSRVQLAYVTQPNGQLSITATNAGANDANSVQLIVTSPNPTSRMMISPTLLGLKAIQQDELRWAIWLPPLKSGATAKFTARFVK